MRALPFLLLILIAGAAGAQESRRTLACEDADGRAFEVALWTPSAFGAPLHCVLGLALGVAPCAPDGGWGLSEPGADRLDAIATEAAGLRHEGGWFFARVGPSELVASASVGRRPPLALEVSGETFWRLRLGLGTLEGSIFTAEGETPFACEG